jgi:hypothetical protein
MSCEDDEQYHDEDKNDEDVAAADDDDGDFAVPRRFAVFTGALPNNMNEIAP